MHSLQVFLCVCVLAIATTVFQDVSASSFTLVSRGSRVPLQNTNNGGDGTCDLSFLTITGFTLGSDCPSTKVLPNHGTCTVSSSGVSFPVTCTDGVPNVGDVITATGLNVDNNGGTTGDDGPTPTPTPDGSCPPVDTELPAGYDFGTCKSGVRLQDGDKCDLSIKAGSGITASFSFTCTNGLLFPPVVLLNNKLLPLMVVAPFQQ